jgi:hypothetical protein
VGRIHAETVGTGAVLDIGYRGIEALVGPVFKAGEMDSNYNHSVTPRFQPVHYQVSVTQYVMRYGVKTGRFLMRKELSLDEIDYETIRKRPVEQLVKYDAAAKRFDFFFKADQTIPTLSFVIDESQLRSEANVAASDREMSHRMWKSSAGTVVEAKYLSRAGDLITLEKPDGTRLTVLFAGFSETDRKLLQRLSGYTPPPTSEDHARQTAAMKKLGERAAGGDLTAIDEIAEIADRLYKDMADDDGARMITNLQLLQPPFWAMGIAAAAGQEGAYNALVYSETRPRLRTFALQGLARAAADGSKPALDRLLNYKANGIRLISATEALILASKQQVPEAVRFMLDVMNRERSKMMMRMAAKGLEPAAKNGNMEARAAIEKYQAAHGPDSSISGD